MFVTSRWRLAGQGVWAILDQAFFAGASFALNLLLARWLGPAEYGLFGVAFTVFLLVSLVHSALVIEPLMVFGSGKYLPAFRRYVWRVLGLLAAVSACGAVLLFIAGLVLNQVEATTALVPLLLTLTWAGPCVILQWTMRRACYVHRRPSVAATGGLLYLALIIGLTVLARETVGLDARVALMIMAVASVVVAAFLGVRLSLSLPADTGSDEDPSAAAVLRTHWVFGRWVLASSLLGWLSADVYYLVLLPQHGYEAAGAVRAAFNLVLPVLHVLTALSSVALPWFVEYYRVGDVRRPALRFAALLTVLAVAYALVLELSAAIVIPLVYGEVFTKIRPLVTVFALQPVATAISAALATALRSMERTRDMFMATVVSAVAGILFGVPLTYWLGGYGAAIAFVLNSAVYAVAVAWRLRRALRSEQAVGEAS